MHRKFVILMVLLSLSLGSSVMAMDAASMISDAVKAVTGLGNPKLAVGGSADAEATINGVGGLVNVGVDAAGGGGIIKQKLASIYSGNIGQDATAKVTIDGAGGVVNVGVGAAGGVVNSEQIVGTIGNPGI